MQPLPGNLFTRPDTLFGVCEGLGQDFGFNPNILRIALAAIILWNPIVAIGSYFALGLLVMLSRLICPDVRVAEVNGAIEEAEPVAPAQAPRILAKAA
jgi:phage shock protein C